MVGAFGGGGAGGRSAGTPQRPRPLDDDKFRSIVTAAVRDAVSFQEEDLAEQRKKAIDYFLGKLFGDEKDGRSQVVITEVRDTILSVLPSLLRIFFSTEKAVEFVPEGPEDEGVAGQATDYVNSIILQDNTWARIIVTWIIDGLLFKVGVVKYAMEEKTEVTGRTYTGLSDEDFLVVSSDPDVTVVWHRMTMPDGTVVEVEQVEAAGALEGPPEDGGDEAEIPPGAPPPGVPAMMAPGSVHDFEIRRTKRVKRVSIVNVPPEEFLVNRSARSLDDARLRGHQRKVTLSDLVAMGYAWEDVEDLGGGDNLDASAEEQARRDDDQQKDTDNGDPSQREVLYTEAFLYVDKDGDGIAELHRVCIGGSEGRILHDEVVDTHPFATWCPVPMPHKFYGLSQADLTMDIQRVKSVLWRQVLDNLVLSNNPRRVVVENQIEDMAEVLSEDLGQVIRVKQAGAIQEIGVTFVAAQALPVMQALDEVKESRTGITRAANGLDPDALQSTTRAAVTATVSAAQGKIEMLARLFAEEGMRALFKGILRLLVRFQDKPRTVRLRGEWVQVDPRDWNASMDVHVNVGLGRGNDDERMAALSMIAARQEGIMAKVGLVNPMVSPTQYYNTLAAMLEIAGYKNPERFFSDPGNMQGMQPPAPPPDPKLLEVQARMQLEAQKHADEVALRREELAMRERLELRRQDIEFGLKRDEQAAEVLLSGRKQELDTAAKLSTPTRMGGQVG